MVDDVGDGFLLVVEAALVDGVLGEVWLDDIELAEVALAVAVAADAGAVVVVPEVVPRELADRAVEVLGLALALVVVMVAALGLDEAGVDGAVEVGEGGVAQFEFGVELWFGGGGGGLALREGPHGGKDSSNKFI